MQNRQPGKAGGFAGSLLMATLGAGRAAIQLLLSSPTDMGLINKMGTPLEK
jgi:hypothetical protein